MGVYLGKDYSAMQGPAPDGFHVPLSSEWQSIIDMLTTLGLITQDKPLSNTNLLTYLKASGSGFLDKDDGSAINLNSSSCVYWCCDKYTDTAGFSYYFSSDNSGPRVYRNVQSMAYAVRAFKNISTVPDNTWTTLYDGSGIATGAGIFHNASLGLISISSNGNTYITIQDKDVGASSVWNYGDTKDNNNCGKKFQRGNNYGFPRQNATPTSSTQVDATNYGPGNYYSSSTFITQSGRTSWDSSDNGNLWGGETEVKPASLKNAYIGGYHEYEYTYDFTTGSTSDLQSKGWTVPTGSVVNSSGYYNSSKNWNAMTITPTQLQTAVQTATKVIYWLSWTASGAHQRTFALASGSTEICLFYGDGQSTSGGNQASFGQQTIVNESGYTYGRSGTFTTTVTVDLGNKTRQYEGTNHTTLTGTITDTAIASFRTVDGLRVYGERLAYITGIGVKVLY